jgi:hypothetical protein
MITRFTGMAINVSLLVVSPETFAHLAVDSCPKTSLMHLSKEIHITLEDLTTLIEFLSKIV